MENNNLILKINDNKSKLKEYHIIAYKKVILVPKKPIHWLNLSLIAIGI